MQKLPKFPQEQHLAQTLKTPAAQLAYEKLTIGAQVKNLRKRMHLTQKQLAAKLKTSQSAVARMEKGAQNLSLRALIMIADALNRKLSIRLL